MKDRTVGECREIYEQILDIDVDDIDLLADHYIRAPADVKVLRDFIKNTLGIKSGISVRRSRGAGCYWPTVELAHASVESANLAFGEWPARRNDQEAMQQAVAFHDLRRDAVWHLEKLILKAYPKFATVFPSNPYQDGCTIYLTVS